MNLDYKENKHVTIVITEACNLNCSYCYEQYKTKRKMPLELAKKIIDDEMNSLLPGQDVIFDLFGGEPIIAFDTIKALVEYALEKKYMEHCFFFATTNGTLIHGEIAKWLEEHKDYIWMGLSLDGTKEMHDINRSHSFDDIDLAFFAKNYPTQDIKMTISLESLPHLADGVIFCHQSGFGVSCNLAYNIDWSDPKNEEILKRELNKLIDFYLANPNYNPCSLLSGALGGVCNDRDKPLPRLCGSGLTMVAYDVEGNRYPCQFFMPNSIGEKAKKWGEIEIPKLTPKEILDDKCQDCVVKSICMICYGANYAATGSVFKKDDNMCRLSKIIFKARSYFQGKQYELGQLGKMSEEEKTRLLKAILIIQREL